MIVYLKFTKRFLDGPCNIISHFSFEHINRVIVVLEGYIQNYWSYKLNSYVLYLMYKSID